MALRISSGKGEVQIMQFQKLSGKFHFLLWFCMHNWSETYVRHICTRNWSETYVRHMSHFSYACKTKGENGISRLISALCINWMWVWVKKEDALKVVPVLIFLLYMCHGLSLLEMHLGGNDQWPWCHPTSLGILGAQWPNTYLLLGRAPLGGAYGQRSLLHCTPTLVGS